MASQRPDGLWHARRRGTRPDGTRFRQSFYGQTEAEAEAQADAWDNHSQGGGHGPLGDYATKCYLPTVQHLSYKWREQITWALDKHITPRFGDEYLPTITRHDIQLFLNTKAETLSTRSVGHIRKVLGAIFNLAEIDGRIDRNPMRGIKLASPKEPEKVIYTPEQCSALFYAAEGQTIQMPIMLAAFLGMRLGECLGLHRSDITPKEVKVVRQVQKQGKVTLVKDLKTDSSTRVIPLPEGWYAHFYAHSIKSGSVFACPNTIKDFQNPENISRALELACKKAKLPRCTFHHLRSSFASNMDALGCPSRVKKEIMGHKAGDVTEGYSRGFDETKTRFLGMLFEPLQKGQRLPDAGCKGGRSGEALTQLVAH